MADYRPNKRVTFKPRLQPEMTAQDQALIGNVLPQPMTATVSRSLTLAQQVRNVLEELEFDPIVEAVARYRDPATPNASKDYCLGLITDRVLPKMKAIEVSNTANDQQQIVLNILAGERPKTVEATIEAHEPILVDLDDDYIDDDE